MDTELGVSLVREVSDYVVSTSQEKCFRVRTRIPCYIG